MDKIMYLLKMAIIYMIVFQQGVIDEYSLINIEKQTAMYETGYYDISYDMFSQTNGAKKLNKEKEKILSYFNKKIEKSNKENHSDCSLLTEEDLDFTDETKINSLKNYVVSDIDKLQCDEDHVIFKKDITKYYWRFTIIKKEDVMDDYYSECSSYKGYIYPYKPKDKKEEDCLVIDNMYIYLEAVCPCGPSYETLMLKYGDGITAYYAKEIALSLAQEQETSKNIRYVYVDFGGNDDIWEKGYIVFVDEKAKYTYGTLKIKTGKFSKDTPQEVIDLIENNIEYINSKVDNYLTSTIQNNLFSYNVVISTLKACEKYCVD